MDNYTKSITSGTKTEHINSYDFFELKKILKEVFSFNLRTLSKCFNIFHYENKSG